MLGRGRGVHGGRTVPAAAHRIRGSVPGAGCAWRLPPRPLPPGPAPFLRPRAARAHPRAALLPVRQRRVRRAPAPDLRARLRLLRARPGAALLPRTFRRLRAQPDLPVRGGATWDGSEVGRGWVADAKGLWEPKGWRLGGAGPPAHPPPVAPRRPRLLAFQASCAPAPSAPDGCLLDQAPRCLRAYAGLVGTHCRDPGAGWGSPGDASAWVGRLLSPRGSSQAPTSLPTMWTTRARAWRPGATAEPAETGVRSVKPSGGSSPGTAAWVRGQAGRR